MKRFGVLAILVFAAVVIFFLVPKKKPNILVILIDTLRADHLGYMGYERETSPNLDRFARENLVFKRAVASASWTPPSVASLFSGMYASVHGHMPLRSQTEYGKRFTKLDESFVTVAELFKEAGYATAGITGNPIVSERYGLSQGFELFVSKEREDAEKINFRAKKYISQLWPREKPLFLYLQYMDPHDPYEPKPPFDQKFKGALKSRSYAESELDLINRYDGEIAYTDQKISELFSWLKEQGLYDDLIILIVSDHGEQFKERGYQGHADRSYQEEVHIPFVLKANGLSGVEETAVNLVDVFPTLLDLAGIKLNHRVHGYSLIKQLAARKKEGVISEIIRHVNEKSYTSPEGFKLINEYEMQLGLVLKPEDLTNQEKLVSSKLFDTNKDPFETAPLDDPALRERLEEEYTSLYKKLLQQKEGYKTGDVELDDKAIEELKTLGYI